ncbi:MAG TPA: alpha/beta hydrolase, partial [Polyangiaceae bacterium]|nr:alpha/beta hydrolase [Polyangiaceae bacterium]
GGMLSYLLASEHPELVGQLIVLNAPHPASYARALKRSLQLFRGWYILFFQLRGVAEWVMTRRPIFRWMMRQLVAQRALLTEARVEAGRRELLRPGAIRGGLSYYRAWLRWPIRGLRRIASPTLVVWGDADPTLDVHLLDDLPEHVEKLEIRRIEGAGHFVHWDEPERVLNAVVNFLAGGRLQ